MGIDDADVAYSGEELIIRRRLQENGLFTIEAITLATPLLENYPQYGNDAAAFSDNLLNNLNQAVADGRYASTLNNATKAAGGAALSNVQSSSIRVTTRSVGVILPPTASPTQAPTYPRDESINSLSDGEIAGTVIAVLAGIIIISLILYFYIIQYTTSSAVGSKLTTFAGSNVAGQQAETSPEEVNVNLEDGKGASPESPQTGDGTPPTAKVGAGGSGGARQSLGWRDWRQSLGLRHRDQADLDPGANEAADAPQTLTYDEESEARV